VDTDDLMMFTEPGPPAAVAEGAAFIVNRVDLPATGAVTMEDLLASYLDRRPLGDGYTPVGPPLPTTPGGLDALEVAVENAGHSADGGQIAPAMRGAVTLVRTPGGSVFALAARAQAVDWADKGPLFETIRGSAEWR